MAHVEGTLCLVNTHGPWFRVQGRHLAKPGLRVRLSPQEGVIIDAVFGRQVWVTLGWYPRHLACREVRGVGGLPSLRHRCWAKSLRARTIIFPAVAS
jgi:hypothetical protein